MDKVTVRKVSGLEHPPMSLLNEFLSTIDLNQLDTLISQKQGSAAAINNTLSFQNLQLSVEANSSTIEDSTICGYPMTGRLNL